MARADATQQAERVNLAFRWLRRGLSLPDVVRRLTEEIGISARQAHRYVQQAQKLDAPLQAVEAKVVFTVKLPQTLVARLHQYAEATGQTLSHIVTQALWALFRRGGRG